ncbi:MAG: peptidoglycan domain protein [Epsilonproteobacteria bacterium]|nr:peptidoglycan domain protein [Campylobacterota bacterium]
MANFQTSFNLIEFLEFNSPENALEKNPGERGLTFMGIYQLAHPHSKIWDLVLKEAKKYLPHLNNKEKLWTIPGKIRGKIGKKLYSTPEALEEVQKIYRREYWDKIRGDDIESQKVANRLFAFAVNAGVKRSSKLLQKIVGVREDGIIGKITLGALNSIPTPGVVSKGFDLGMESYYKGLVINKPKYKIYLKGWLNRIKKIEEFERGKEKGL